MSPAAAAVEQDSRDREVGMQAAKIKCSHAWDPNEDRFCHNCALPLSPSRTPADWMMRRERRRREGEGSAKRFAIKGINNGSVFGFAPGAAQQPLSLSLAGYQARKKLHFH